MSIESTPIKIWNRYTGNEEIETVYGDGLIKWLYQTKPGQSVSSYLVKPLLTKASGVYQDSFLSSFGIKNFVSNFSIPMKDYEEGPFRSFNDFFIRKFRSGKRSFNPQNNILPAFAEGRYLGFEKVNPQQKFPVKGNFLTAAKLLGENEIAEKLEGGPLLIARLCPVDYHRFHYPDDGRTEMQYRLHGDFHSVNPAALKFKGDIFVTNERHVSILKTNNFGRIAYVEVGAFFVGKIIQTHAVESPFLRGDEKGYFLFGGSTVIVLGEPGAWKPSDDILKQTAKSLETYVKLGDPVAIKK